MPGPERKAVVVRRAQAGLPSHRGKLACLRLRGTGASWVTGRGRSDRHRSADRGQPPRPTDAQHGQHPPLCSTHRLRHDQSTTPIRIERETAINAQLDGDNGPGQWVSVVAMEIAIRKRGKASLSSAHIVPIILVPPATTPGWPRRRTDRTVHDKRRVILAPTGGLTPTFGNNPLGVGIPAKRNPPILLDIAMSVAAKGKIGLQLAEGKPLPPGWILDRVGRPSIDPADLAAGLGVPIGGHKGYGLRSSGGAGWHSDRSRLLLRPST